LVRRFATESKRSPEAAELIRFLAEIGNSRTIRVQ
jgi:homocitrate synthase NifV